MNNINTIIAQFDLQTSWFLNALENCSEDESNTRFSEHLNPIKWVAGHLTDARFTIHALISGSEINDPYKRLFSKGTNNQTDSSFPTIEQIQVDWITVSGLLKKALQGMPEEQWLSKPPFQTAIPDETLSGLIAYFAMHESFHIGQLSIYRKLLGKPAMAMGRR